MLVVWGWTFIGLIVQAYGFWLLFCEFIPTVLQFTRRVPFLGKVLDYPVFKTVRAGMRWWRPLEARDALQQVWWRATERGLRSSGFYLGGRSCMGAYTTRHARNG